MSQNDKPSMPDITVPYDQFQISGIAYWIEANGYKPHLLVNTRHLGVKLPPQCMRKEQEVINIHTTACGKFNWADDRMEFNARFGGQEFHLIIPYHAILAMNFAGTGQWITMPWAMLANATGKEEVQITAVSDAELAEEGTALDGMDDKDIVQPSEVLAAQASVVPEGINGMNGKTVTAVDFRSRARAPK
jgi:stringent starvation protein B